MTPRSASGSPLSQERLKNNHKPLDPQNQPLLLPLLAPSAPGAWKRPRILVYTEPWESQLGHRRATTHTFNVKTHPPKKACSPARVANSQSPWSMVHPPSVLHFNKPWICQKKKENTSYLKAPQGPDNSFPLFQWRKAQHLDSLLWIQKERQINEYIKHSDCFFKHQERARETPPILQAPCRQPHHADSRTAPGAAS